MAKFTPSALIDSISGTIGGSTLSRTGVIRKKPRAHAARVKLGSANPTLDPTTQGPPWWNLMDFLSREWNALTADQQLQWNTAAGVYSRQNANSSRHPISGRNLFFLFNSARLYTTTTTSSEPPQISTQFPPEQSTCFAQASGVFRFQQGKIPAGTGLKIHILAARSFRLYPYKAFKSWTYITTHVATGAGTNVSPLIVYKLGTPATGEIVGFRWRFVSQNVLPSAWTFGTRVTLA